jgi:acetyl esterase/lipase
MRTNTYEKQSLKVTIIVKSFEWRRVVFVVSLAACLNADVGCARGPNANVHEWKERMITTNVVYKTVGDIALKLDLDLPKGKGPFPIVLYVHGGGWKPSDDTGQFAAQSSHLTGKGIAGARITYRGRGQGTVSDSLADTMDAVQWLRDNAKSYNLDVTRLGIAGGSAGAHLAALAAQRVPECVCFVGFNGPYDLPAMRQYRGSSWDEWRDTFFEGSSEEALRKASPVYQLRAPPPATLLIHGIADTTVPYDQSVTFAEAVKAKGNHATVELYAGEQHAFFNAGRPQFRPTLAAMERFLIMVFDLE